MNKTNNNSNYNNNSQRQSSLHTFLSWVFMGSDFALHFFDWSALDPRLMLTSGLGASALHRCIVGISLQISRSSLQMKQKFDCGNAGRHFWNSKKVSIYIHKFINCTVWVVGVVSLSSSNSRDMSSCLAKFPHSQPSLGHIQKPNDFLHSHTHTDTHTRTHPRSLDTPERERKRVQIMSRGALSHLLLAVLSCCNSTRSKAETS